MINIVRKLRTAVNNPQNAPSMIQRRLATKMSYNLCHLLGAHASPPESINIYPTDRCNLKCSMCFEKLRELHPEMAVTDWMSIINQIKKFQPRIHLSGGEPFVYPGIKDLIDYIKKNHLFLTITTNGTSLSEYAEEITQWKVNRIHISIDGPREVHDSIRGVKGTFDRIMEGLTQIQKLRKHHTLPVIRINSMINFANPDVMQEMIKIGYTHNVESIQFLHPLFVDAQGLAAHGLYLQKYLHRDLNYWQAADIACDKPKSFSEANGVLRKLRNERSIRVNIVPQFNLEQLKEYYNVSSSFYSIYQGRCQVMWNTATILASGEVESCPDYILGNCREKPFPTLWNDEKMKMLRYRIRNRNFFTVCRACCFFYV